MHLQFAPQLTYNEGLALAKSGDQNQAIFKMREAVAELPNMPSAYIVLGKLYAQRSDWAMARYWWEKTLERWPDEEAAREGLATITARDTVQTEAEDDRQRPVFVRRQRKSGIQTLWSFLLGGVVVGLLLVSLNLFPSTTQIPSASVGATPTLIPRWTPAPAPVLGR